MMRSRVYESFASLISLQIVFVFFFWVCLGFFGLVGQAMFRYCIKNQMKVKLN